MRHILFALAATIAVLVAVPASAQKTATQFYMDYQAAWSKATSIESLLPFMAKENASQVQATPAAERKEMFEMLKMMNDIKNVKVTEETKTSTGYMLEVSGVGSDKKTVTGTADIVIEGGAMKLKKESWKM